MFAPHAVDIAVTISSLISSLCFTFAELFDDINIFSLRQVKLCISQRKYKQKNKTQTAVINMVVKRMLNNVHLLDVSYVTTYIFRSDR